MTGSNTRRLRNGRNAVIMIGILSGFFEDK
jgi:hypothetical protein